MFLHCRRLLYPHGLPRCPRVSTLSCAIQETTVPGMGSPNVLGSLCCAVQETTVGSPGVPGSVL